MDFLTFNNLYLAFFFKCLSLHKNGIKLKDDPNHNWDKIHTFPFHNLSEIEEKFIFKAEYVEAKKLFGLWAGSKVAGFLHIFTYTDHGLF